MARPSLMLALVVLLSSAPLVTGGVALAQPAGTPDHAAAPAEPSVQNRVGTATGNGSGNANPANSDAPVNRTTVPPVEQSAPATPMPMNLPDHATAAEVKNEYGFGIAGLIIGTLLVAAVVIGVIFLISRRSWSTSH